ncbi:MAG: S-layer homology domain-containing protein [Gammaproteobacteria bacterium]|nr:S-layer homology domain-containing protein [Gammaproteobacteria bacterium]
MKKQIIAILTGALISAGAAADTSEKAFGPSNSYSVITKHALVDANDTMFDWGVPDTTPACAIDGSVVRGITTVHLDSGVLLNRIDAFGTDNDPVLNVRVGLFEACHSGPNAGGLPDVLATLVSSGTPGEFEVGSDLSKTIDRKNCSYYVGASATFNNAGNCPDKEDLLTTIERIRFSWQRQIAPGPSMPSFFDVPNSHPFYDSIEALASSGITGGCGGSNFCPDDAVTRGQFAAFFSRALGLGSE